MKTKTAILLSLGVFLTVSCTDRTQESQVPDLSWTPCQQTQQQSMQKSSRQSRAEVSFTDKGVQITYYNFEVTCDFTRVNVSHTFVNGVLNITQQGAPNQADCVCYTDVSYTISGIAQSEVNVIFINGVQVYCYNDYEACAGNIDLKIGETTEIQPGETACNAPHGLSLRVEDIMDSRCPIGVNCIWSGPAAVQFHLTTKKGEYSFTLDTHPTIKNDTVIEGFKYRLRNVLPYPVYGRDSIPTVTVRILVDEDIDDGFVNAIVCGQGMDCGLPLIQFEDEDAAPSSYRTYHAINLPEKCKIIHERISIKFRTPNEDELMPCTAMGPAYPSIYIIEAK